MTSPDEPTPQWPPPAQPAGPPPGQPGGPPPWPPAGSPPYPPAGAPPYPPGQVWLPPVAPKKSRRTLWIALAIVFVVVAGCAGIVGTLAFKTGQGADRALNAFLDAAERGDVEGALAHACSDATKDNVPAITHHKVRGVQIFRGNGQTTAQITVDLTFPDSSVHRDVVYLEKHDGTWLVCGNERVK